MGGGIAGPNLKEPFSFQKNKRALLYCSFFVLGAVLYGYDGTYFSGVLEMPLFLRNFGDATNADGTPAFTSGTLSLFSSIVQAGELVGSLCAAFIGGYFGRRGGLIAASIFVCLGSILQLAATSGRALITVGRLILGMGIGVISNAVPLYLGESSPSAIRGIVVGSWQLLLAIGQVIGAGVNQGTKDIDSTASYRIPFGLNFAIPLIFFCFVGFIPESPRWLVSKGRDDKALRNIEKINHSNPDADPDYILHEYKADHEESMALGKPNLTEIFTDPVERRKLITVFGILACQQISGVQFIFSYATVLASNLQLSDPFVITMIINVIEVVGVLAGFLVIERFGRRTLLLFSSVWMTLSLLIVGGMGSGPELAPTVPPPAYGKTAIAFICIYVFYFNVSWGPLAWTIASENALGRNRSLIMGIGTASFWIVAWAVTFSLPYLYNNEPGSAGLGLKIGYIYAGGSLIAAAFVFFCVGETRGRTLEEIGEMYRRKVPTRKWSTYTPSLYEGTTDKGALISENDKKKAVRQHVERSSSHLGTV